MFPVETIAQHDITTKEGWNAEVLQWRQHLENQGTEKDYEPTTCFIWSTRNWDGFEPYAAPKLTIIGTTFTGNTAEEADEHKAAFEFYLRAFTVAGAALATLAMTEIWMAHVPMDQPWPNVRASEHPSRVEALYMPHAHRDFGVSAWAREIVRDAQRARTGKPWFAMPGHSRFAFVPPPQLVDDQLASTIAAIYLKDHKDSVTWIDPKKPASA